MPWELLLSPRALLVSHLLAGTPPLGERRPGCCWLHPEPAQGSAQRAGVCMPVTAAASGVVASGLLGLGRLVPPGPCPRAAPANGQCCGAVVGTPGFLTPRGASGSRFPLEPSPLLSAGNVPSMASFPSLTCFSACVWTSYSNSMPGTAPRAPLRPSLQPCAPGLAFSSTLACPCPCPTDPQPPTIPPLAATPGNSVPNRTDDLGLPGFLLLGSRVRELKIAGAAWPGKYLVFPEGVVPRALRRG